MPQELMPQRLEEADRVGAVVDLFTVKR